MKLLKIRIEKVKNNSKEWKFIFKIKWQTKKKQSVEF